MKITPETKPTPNTRFEGFGERGRGRRVPRGPCLRTPSSPTRSPGRTCPRLVVRALAPRRCRTRGVRDAHHDDEHVRAGPSFYPTPPPALSPPPTRRWPQRAPPPVPTCRATALVR